MRIGYYLEGVMSEGREYLKGGVPQKGDITGDGPRSMMIVNYITIDR